MMDTTRTIRILATLAVVAAAPAAEAAAQSCPAGQVEKTWLGIETFHCQGGTCLVAGTAATTDTTFGRRVEQLRARHPQPYSFSVEPYLWEIDPDGPGAGKLREGDILVSVNGYPITTTEGGMTLARAMPGVPMELTVRRERPPVPGSTTRWRLYPSHTVVVTPERTCVPLRASAGPGKMPWTMASPPTRPVAPVVTEDDGLVRVNGLGFSLLGSKEIEIGPDGALRWWFKDVPTVATVEEGSLAEELGIRPGEELVTVNGAWVDTPEGVAALTAVAAGAEGQLIVRFDNRARGVRVEAR